MDNPLLNGIPEISMIERTKKNAKARDTLPEAMNIKI